MCISCFCKHVILNIIGIYVWTHGIYIYITYVHIHIKRFICRCGGYLYCLSYGMCSRPALPCLTSAFMYMHWVVKFRLMHLRLRGRKKHSPSLTICVRFPVAMRHLPYSRTLNLCHYEVLAWVAISYPFYV